MVFRLNQAMRKELIPPAGEPAKASLPRQPNPRQRILVVDDDPDIRNLNTKVLTLSGYDVDAAEDGAQAWDVLQVNNYDLIVTDNNMPKVTGVELLKKVHAANMDLPAIMVTGEPPTDELSRHPWLQIEAILLKPYGFEELLATVKNVLFATGSETEQSLPPTNWSGQSLDNGMRL
jgi:DNA-binding response OmpR family regulator